MDGLPEEIVSDILSRLPVRPLMLCRCVCKPWRSITRDPRFIASHLTRSSREHSGLILSSTISFDAISFHTKLHFLERSKPQNFTCREVNFSFPNFQEFRVIGSCNGLLWLVSRTNGYRTYIINPFTRYYITFLINLPYLKVKYVRGFGFCANSYELKMVVIADAIGAQLAVFVYTFADRRWRVVRIVPYGIKERFPPQVLVNGALHWVSCDPQNLIVSFDFADEVFVVMPHPPIDVVDVGDYSLGVLSDCLSLTDSSASDHFDIWVLKDYGVKESWAKYFSISFNQDGLNLGKIQTVCFENGELLMICGNQFLISYNPQTMSLRKLKIPGLPPWFEAITHVGSLVLPRHDW